MLNRYPWWKYLLIVSLLTLGLLYALPNLYAPDPAVQVSGESSAMVLDDQALDLVTTVLDENGIEHFGAEVSEGGRNLLIRLRDQEKQLTAPAVDRNQARRWLCGGLESCPHHAGVAWQYRCPADETGS